MRICLALGVRRCSLAMRCTALSAVAALGVAALVFRRGDRALAGAALCAATLLMSPYLFFYDFTLLAVGAALLGAPRDRFELIALVAAWGAGLSLTIGYYAPVPLCPLAAWLMLLAAARRARAGACPTRRTPNLPRSAQSYAAQEGERLAESDAGGELQRRREKLQQSKRGERDAPRAERKRHQRDRRHRTGDREQHSGRPNRW